MQTWQNGEKAEVVRNIINKNFNKLERHLSDSILALSTERRLLLSSEYLRSGLIIFDTDLKSWLIYNGKTKTWDDYTPPYVGYSKAISFSDWGVTQSVVVPFSEHLTPNPAVYLYILCNGEYELVHGGYSVDSNFNIILLTDLAFEGKVVVK